jgi:ABC-type nitrate/sulfonate/bicarbonate transport system substrate-binding protein
MLTAAAQGAKLKILLSLFAERASYDFLVSPSITRPADLKGKKIGVQDFSGLLWTLTMLSLRELGLDPQRDNINIQAIGDSTVIAQSLTSGIIDAAALDKLQSVRLQGLGVKVLLDLSRVAFPSSPFMGAEAFIQKNPQVVENLYQGADRIQYNYAGSKGKRPRRSAATYQSRPGARRDRLQESFERSDGLYFYQRKGLKNRTGYHRPA